MFALLRALNDAGLNVEAIEPAELACARAIYGKKIVNSFDFNVLIALVEKSEVILSVFRNQTLDFVRKRDIGEDICQSEQGLGRFAEEIGAIIQYYDMEIGDRVQNWRLITVLRQDGQRADEIGDFLRGKFRSSEVEVVSSASISENTPVVMESDTQRASVVAVGLAMRLLDVPQPKIKINLLPPESAEVKAAKQHVLITANIVAVILAVMILTVGVLSAALNKKSETIAQLKENKSRLDTRTILVEQKRVSEQAESFREKLEKLNGVLRTGHKGDWNVILDDIRQATPRSLWITSLTSGRQSKVLIKGLSTSYEAVRLFVDMLGKSEYIVSADLVGAGKDEGAGGLISYSIDCSLATFEGT
jgi:Tfp pilus assembly protein PilN